MQMSLLSIFYLYQIFFAKPELLFHFVSWKKLRHSQQRNFQSKMTRQKLARKAAVQRPTHFYRFRLCVLIEIIKLVPLIRNPDSHEEMQLMN